MGTTGDHDKRNKPDTETNTTCSHLYVKAKKLMSNKGIEEWVSETWKDVRGWWREDGKWKDTAGQRGSTSNIL